MIAETISFCRRQNFALRGHCERYSYREVGYNEEKDPTFYHGNLDYPLVYPQSTKNIVPGYVTVSLLQPLVAASD